jgi:hypothetical protein
MITDWYMSPFIYLKREPEIDPASRLDRILKKKAKEGTGYEREREIRAQFI